MTTRTFEEYQREKREREWNDRVKKQKEAMGNAERVQRATEWKRIGNEKVKSGNMLEAKDYYLEAVIYVEDLVDARRKERNDLLVPLYCNLAQVHLRLDEAEAAETAAGKVLAIAEIPRNGVTAVFQAKAHYRRGLARRARGKLEEARDDFAAALRLQPGSEEVVSSLEEAKKAVAAEAKKAQASMGGFLNRGEDQRRRRQEQERLRGERRRRAEDGRLERRARAEQRQQMQEAFKKLSEGKMLYEEREEEMEPIRKKEEEKKQTIELEKNLMNIIDESKGKPKTEKFDDYIKQREARAEEQSVELDQKKKILDKKKKEQQWDEDDVWRGQRDDHRRRLEAEQQAGLLPQGPKAMWQAAEVSRWCEQRLRDILLGTFVEGDKLEPQQAARALGKEPADVPSGCILKALVTDVLKLQGDASVLRLNPHKPPLHFFDYFLKLDWEVATARPGDRSYRTADELIQVAADGADQKAPPSISKNRVLAGTFKVRELSSEEEPADGAWPLEVKVKRQTEEPMVASAAGQLRDALAGKVQRLLCRWVDEYRGHWA